MAHVTPFIAKKHRRVGQEREFWSPDKRNPGFGLHCQGEKSRSSYPPELDKKSAGGLIRSENFAALTKGVPVLDYVVRAKNLEAPTRRS